MEILLSIILGILFAFRNRSIAKSKGYQGRRAFLGGLCFTFISTIYTAMKPKTLKKKAEEMKLMKEMMGE